MKNQLLLLIGLLVAGKATAQTQKGNGLLSGEITASYQRFTAPNNGVSLKLTENGSSVTSLTAGHFWADNWLTGVSASVSTANSSQYSPSVVAGGTARFSNTALALTPFVRRYWQVNSVYLFAGLGLSGSTTVSKQSSADANGQVINDTRQQRLISVSPLAEVGANYFLTNRLGLQLRAAATALPLNTASLSAGLVYWTGSDRRTGAPEGRDNPQTNSGNWVVEGSFSVSSQQNKTVANPATVTNQTTTTTSISPSVGRFFGKNNLIGLSIPFTYSSNDGNPQSEMRSWAIGFSPYYQHYWTSTRLTPFTRIHVGYSRGDAKARGTNRSIYQYDEGNGGVSLGLAYMAGQRLIIETSLVQASVSYSNFKQPDFGSYTKGWHASLSGGLTGGFAVRYVL